MKKYLQISVVLGVFGLLVFLRQLKGNDLPVVVANQNSSNPVSPALTAVQSSQSLTPTPSSSLSPVAQPPTATPQVSQGAYKNGTYNGSTEDAFYGLVQAQVIVSGGKITGVNFLQYPNDNPTSQYVNSQAMPLLKQEVLQAQSDQINGVSGASATSQAFQVSLTNALAQAK